MTTIRKVIRKTIPSSYGNRNNLRTSDSESKQLSSRAGQRIIKNDRIREYEKSFCLQCKKYRGKRISGRFKLFIRVWHGNIRFDLDNALKTILDCLQMVEAITNDSLCFEIHAEKRIDRRNPRVEFGLEEINEQKNIFSQNKASENHFHLSDEQEYQKE